MIDARDVKQGDERRPTCNTSQKLNFSVGAVAIASAVAIVAYVMHLMKG